MTTRYERNRMAYDGPWQVLDKICSCTAADGEEVNMRVCDEHFWEAYAEAQRLHPAWPRSDLRIRANEMVLNGWMP